MMTDTESRNQRQRLVFLVLVVLHQCMGFLVSYIKLICAELTVLTVDQIDGNWDIQILLT